jgi:SAM-dependent methyltransferase
MGTVVWGEEIARAFDAVNAAQFRPEVLDPAVDFLSGYVRDGNALEFAIGTGRIALPLSDRGVRVTGIELSAQMAGVLAKKPGADAIDVIVGDMATTSVPGRFGLVYLVANTIMNVTTQDEQVSVFENAAAHLRPGGVFVLEVIVPSLRRLPPGEIGHVFDMTPGHVGVDTFDDVLTQETWSHHWHEVDGRWVHQSAPYRYVWPAEMDLMARIAGLRLRERWADWHRNPFTPESPSQVVVYEKPATAG